MQNADSPLLEYTLLLILPPIQLQQQTEQKVTQFLFGTHMLLKRLPPAYCCLVFHLEKRDDHFCLHCHFWRLRRIDRGGHMFICCGHLDWSRHHRGHDCPAGSLASLRAPTRRRRVCLDKRRGAALLLSTRTCSTRGVVRRQTITITSIAAATTPTAGRP